MAKLSDEITETIPCSHCGHEITQSLTRLKNTPVIVCPSCGQSTKVESDGTIREVADQIDELDRTLDKFTKG